MRLCLPALPPSRAPATPETWSSVSKTSAWSRPLVLCRNASPTPPHAETRAEFTVSEERTVVRKCPCMVTFYCSSNRRTRQLHAPACRESSYVSGQAYIFEIGTCCRHALRIPSQAPPSPHA